MSDQTFITCPHCGEPVVMTSLQHELFRGRTLACVRCAKQYTVTPEQTPLYSMPPARSRWGGPEPGYTSAGPWAPAHSGAAAAASGRAAAETADPSASAESPTEPAATAGPRPRPAASPPKQEQGMSGATIAAIVVVVALLLVGGGLAAVLFPALNRAQAQSERLQCANQMKQIGLAVQMYANSNRGQLPDGLDKLLTQQLITPNMLVCPAGDQTPAPGASPGLQAANLLTSPQLHLSYVYTGGGMTSAVFANPNVIILHEPLNNHDNDGINVLYANGSVTYLPKAQAQQVIRQLQAGGMIPSSAASPPAGQPGGTSGSGASGGS